MALVHDSAAAMEGGSAATNTAEEETGLPAAVTDTPVEVCRRGLWRTLMTGGDVVQDEAEFGARCQIAPPVATVTTWRHVVFGYPGHCLRECRDGMPLFAMVSIFTVVYSMIMRQVVQDFSLPSGSMFSQYLLALPSSENGFAWYTLYLSIFTALSIFAHGGAIMMLLYWYRCMNMQSFWGGLFVMVLLRVLSMVFCLMATWSNPSKTAVLLPLSQSTVPCIICVVTFGLMLRWVPSKLFPTRSKICLASLVSGVGLFTEVFLAIIKSSIGSSDLHKLSVILFLPLAWNLLIVPGMRLLERSLVHCDPSTLGWQQCVNSTFEKLFRRVLLASMKDPAFVLLASICNTALRLLISLVLGEEDWRVYALCGARMKVANPMQNVHLPAYGWTSKRLATYQTQGFIMNSTMDITLILGLAIWRIASGVADGAGIEVSYTNILANMMIQLVFAVFMQASFAVYVTVYLKVDFISFARMKCEGWRFMICVYFIMVFNNLFMLLVQSIVCVSPSARGSAIHLC